MNATAVADSQIVFELIQLIRGRSNVLNTKLLNSYSNVLNASIFEKAAAFQMHTSGVKTSCSDIFKTFEEIFIK